MPVLVTQEHLQEDSGRDIVQGWRVHDFHVAAVTGAVVAG